jgi:tRNA-dihydrouridine synthase
MDTSEIIKVRKNAKGNITDIMLDNGNVYSISEAIMMAKDGLIEGVNVGRAKDGREFLRSDPNGTENDNLDNLPTF